ncbi:MAG: hypothetical protein AMXMBFR23_17930 [Chloroflexota bacterium]
MHGDNGPVLDLDSAAEAIEEADVMVVGFDFTADRLLIDLRLDTDGHTPPLIEMVEPLNDAHERTLWLQDRRPLVAPPERFIFFTWPHTAAFLEESALLDVAARRMVREHGVDLSEDVAAILLDLRQREAEDTLSAVVGAEGFQTIWSRAD